MVDLRHGFVRSSCAPNEALAPSSSADFSFSKSAVEVIGDGRGEGVLAPLTDFEIFTFFY